LLLGVGIIVALLAAFGFWLDQTPGHGTSIEQSTHTPTCEMMVMILRPVHQQLVLDRLRVRLESAGRLPLRAIRRDNLPAWYA
jgi:hypothetical protein